MKSSKKKSSKKKSSKRRRGSNRRKQKGGNADKTLDSLFGGFNDNIIVGAGDFCNCGKE
jgi:hypothetical protein